MERKEGASRPSPVAERLYISSSEELPRPSSARSPVQPSVPNGQSGFLMYSNYRAAICICFGALSVQAEPVHIVHYLLWFICDLNNFSVLGKVNINLQKLETEM